MPSKNVRKTVKIDKIILIGNKLKPETVSIYLRFFIMYFSFGESITSVFEGVEGRHGGDE